MMTQRRSFLKNAVGIGGSLLLSKDISSIIGESAFRLIQNSKNKDSQALARDEEFWQYVKQCYTVSPTVMNLNNGGVSPSPKVVQDAVDRYNRLCNESPSYYMWRTLDMGREPLRDKLALLAGCSSDEIAINRNSSEALETIIFGLRLKAGDEVVLTKQDYPNMINAWKQREKRDGVVLKWLDFDFPIEDDDVIVEAYRNAISDNTKLVHITHIINWNGQILPARKIADMAHERGVEVLVDAAHSFAHINYTIPDLDCDYFGTSLHKWLCAPIGSGLLYVKKEKISQLYPLFGAVEPESDDIRKFESLGTRSFAIEQAIGQALDFHNMIGIEHKHARLQYLKNYWAEKAVQFEGYSVGTSLNADYACALCLLKLKGVKPSALSSALFKKYKIHTVAIDWHNIQGVRVTPNVYTLTEDLDRFLMALEEVREPLMTAENE